MAIVMLLHWPEATQELYDKVREQADWEGNRPAGGQLHLVGWADDGMHIVDVWDSAEDFQSFFRSRVMPVIEEAGMTTEPDVKIFDMYGIYAPAFGQDRQTATV
jgi:hypothetical protein